MRTLILALVAGVAGGQPPAVIQATDYVVIDTTLSKIDLQSQGDDYKLSITCNYSALNAEVMHIRVYDENAGQWAVVSNNIAVAAGVGSKTRTYTIPKSSAWGVSIAAGRFDEAYVEVEMSSAGTPGGTINHAAWVSAK